MTISSGVALACDLDEVLRKAVDALIPFGALAVRELPGPDRVGQEIEHISAVFRVFQHGAEQGDEDGGRRRNAERGGNAERVQALFEHKGDAGDARGFEQQHEMRVGDEGRETPVRFCRTARSCRRTSAASRSTRRWKTVRQIGAARSRWMKSSKRRKS